LAVHELAFATQWLSASGHAVSLRVNVDSASSRNRSAMPRPDRRAGGCTSAASGGNPRGVMTQFNAGGERPLRSTHPRVRSSNAGTPRAARIDAGRYLHHFLIRRYRVLARSRRADLGQQVRGETSSRRSSASFRPHQSLSGPPARPSAQIHLCRFCSAAAADGYSSDDLCARACEARSKRAA